MSNLLTKRDLLQKHYDMAYHNLMCYSKNLAMDTAKEGFEEEWQNALNERDLLKEMINELPLLYTNNQEFIVCGTVSSWSSVPSKANNENYMESLIISDREGNGRLFTIDYEVGKELMEVYDTERHNRYEKGLDADIVFTVSNFSQRVERWEWKSNCPNLGSDGETESVASKTCEAINNPDDVYDGISKRLQNLGEVLDRKVYKLVVEDVICQIVDRYGLEAHGFTDEQLLALVKAGEKGAECIPWSEFINAGLDEWEHENETFEQ